MYLFVIPGVWTPSVYVIAQNVHIQQRDRPVVPVWPLPYRLTAVLDHHFHRHF